MIGEILEPRMEEIVSLIADPSWSRTSLMRDSAQRGGAHRRQRPSLQYLPELARPDLW